MLAKYVAFFNTIVESMQRYHTILLYVSTYIAAYYTIMIIYKHNIKIVFNNRSNIIGMNSKD